MKEIILKEWEGLEHKYLDSEVVSFLLSLGRFRIRRNKLVPFGICGFLEYKDVRLIIKPKLDEHDYLRMLSELNMLEGDEAWLSTEDISYWFAKAYLNKLRRYLRIYGPPKEYISYRTYSPVIKGRIVWKSSYVPMYVHQIAWELRQGELSRKLLEAVESIHEIFPTEETFYVLRELRNFLQPSENYENTRPVNPYAFEELLTMASMILARKSPKVSFGNVKVRTFLVDTSKLFERFVLKKLSERYDVSYQPTYDMDGFRMKPDFVIGGIPIDAKYKFELSNTDVYQAIAYAVALNSRRAIIVYPYISHSYKINDVEVEIVAFFNVEEVSI